MTTTADRATCQIWCNAFLGGLKAAGIPEDQQAQLLTDAMPVSIRNGLARMEAEDVVNSMVAKGVLVRMTDGRVIEAHRYDPTIHGPADTCCGLTAFRCQSLKELGDQDDSGVRCCEDCIH